MKLATKGLVTLAALAAAAVSSAAITYENIEATVTFYGNEVDPLVQDLDVDMNGHELDFTADGHPFYIDNVNSLYQYATIEISYTALSDEGISGLALIFSGWAGGDGFVGSQELVVDSEDNLLGGVGDTVTGGPFVVSDFIDFGKEVNEYDVFKFFRIGIGQGQEDSLTIPQNSASFASIGLIEQNAVPEPATMGALAFGALGLLARKRRK